MDLAKLHYFLLQTHLCSLSLAIAAFIIGVTQRRQLKIHTRCMLSYSLLGFITVLTATTMAAISLLFPEFGQNSQSFMAQIAKSIGYPQGPLAGYALGLIPGYAFLFCILETLKEKNLSKRNSFLPVLPKVTILILTALTIVVLATFDKRYSSVYISRASILLFLIISVVLSSQLKSQKRHILNGSISFLIFIETGLQTPTRMAAIRFFNHYQAEFHIAVKMVTAILIFIIYRNLKKESKIRTL